MRTTADARSWKDYLELNREVKGWAKDTSNMSLSEITRLKAYDTYQLFKSLRYRFGYDSGQVEKVSYQFPRYGVFVHKGVGRGWPISRVKASGGKPGGRQPKPWFNPVIDKQLEVLGDIVQKHFGDLTVSEGVKIK